VHREVWETQRLPSRPGDCQEFHNTVLSGNQNPRQSKDLLTLGEDYEN